MLRFFKGTYKRGKGEYKNPSQSPFTKGRSYTRAPISPQLQISLITKERLRGANAPLLLSSPSQIKNNPRTVDVIV
jgi:hypothetical protein